MRARSYIALGATSATLLGSIAVACGSFSGAASGPTDGGVIADGAPSDGAASDAGASETTDFCADASFICDDFDMPATTWPEPPWSNPQYADGGVLGLSDAESFSRPNSLRLADPPGGASGVSLSSNFVGSSSGFHCQLEVFVEEFGTRALDMFALVVGSTVSGEDYYSTRMSLGSTATFFSVNSISATGAAVPLQKWTSMVIDANFSGGSTLTINGQPQASPDGGANTGAPQGTTFTLSASESAVDVTGWEIYVDDVRCDPIP